MAERSFYSLINMTSLSNITFFWGGRKKKEKFPPWLVYLPDDELKSETCHSKTIFLSEKLSLGSKVIIIKVYRL